MRHDISFDPAAGRSRLLRHVIAGDGVPEDTAFFIHARLHARLPRAGAAFHTDMPSATALTKVEGEPLVRVGQTARKFYGRTVANDAYNGLRWTSRRATASPQRQAPPTSSS